MRAGTTASTSLRGAKRRSNPDFPRGGSLDCFAALAMTEFEALERSLNEDLHLQTYLRILAARFARALPCRSRPMIAKGRREGRAPAGTRVRMHRNAHGMDYRSRRSPGLPCADGFNGVLRALLGERCTLAPVAFAACDVRTRLGRRIAARLDGSDRPSGPHDLFRPRTAWPLRQGPMCAPPTINQAAVTIAVSYPRRA